MKCFGHKNTPRSPLPVSGALKTGFVFDCGKIPAKQVLCRRRSKVSASRPYAPDTRGVCFQGPSRALWYFKHPAPLRITAAARARENEIRDLLCGKRCRFLCTFFFCRCRGQISHSFALLRCAVTASAEQPPFGLGCRCGQFKPEFPKKDYLYSSTRRVRCS